MTKFWTVYYRQWKIETYRRGDIGFRRHGHELTGSERGVVTPLRLAGFCQGFRAMVKVKCVDADHVCVGWERFHL